LHDARQDMDVECVNIAIVISIRLL
jgi:hypothetical protein